jgi:hypothetical protein
MRSWLLVSIGCCISSALFSVSAQADCVGPSKATQDSECVVNVWHHDVRGVWTTVGEFDRIAREAAIADESRRQLELVREANQKRAEQVTALEHALAEQKEATSAADTLAAAERLRVDAAEKERDSERERSGAWYRSPLFGAALASGAVLASGALAGRDGVIVSSGLTIGVFVTWRFVR